jgi:hypothetical protein
MVDDVLDSLLPDGNLRVVFVLLLPKVKQSAKLTNFQCEREVFDDGIKDRTSRVFRD